MQNTSLKTRVIIFITCWNIKRQSKVQSYHYFMNSNEQQKKDVSKKISHKKMEQKLSRGFFPLSSDFRKAKFISAFISKLDAIYCLCKAHFSMACRIHGLWQAMRICPPLPWPRVLICGNWLGDMEPNQWKRRQRDRGKNQSLIAEDYAVGRVKRNWKKKKKEIGEKKDRRRCVYQTDIWVLSADCKSARVSEKENRVI